MRSVLPAARRLPLTASEKDELRAALRPWLSENEPLARYTSARIGGPAEFFATADSAEQLAEMARTAWQVGVRLVVLGGGSNVLVSDAGVRGLVILNRARRVDFIEDAEPPRIRAEAGASLGSLARQCILRGLGGLEWAATVPGTLGGAVVGNAGAHGGDLAGQLHMAEILQQDGTVRRWSRDELGLGYRTSALKRQKANGRAAVVLAAELELKRGAPAELQARLESFVAHRKRTQPPGASIGSMFKNPPGDYAGRLIEAAGLKGRRIGNAEISSVHANFFVNLGEARAADVFALIHLAHEAVKTRFGVDLQLEVELVGEWGGQC